MGQIRFFVNNTGMEVDSVEITEDEAKLIDDGKNLMWRDYSKYHLYPSMCGGKRHVCSFELENPWSDEVGSL